MANATAPNISARIFYGLRTDIQYNAHYLSESEIVYPAGGVIIIHNHLHKKQKFIKLQDKHKPIKSLVLAPNRRWLALNEIAEEPGQKPIITIYDLTTYKRRKILTVPDEHCLAKEFACVQFTFDSKYLVAITGDPDYNLYYYNWDKGKVESHAKAQNPNGQGIVDNVQCNPSDATLVVITGPYTFRIMNVVESVWRQWGWSKADNCKITACMWLTPDRIMFGTDHGVIMMVENGELRQNCIFQASEVIEMSLKKVEAETDQEEDKGSTSSKQDTTSVSLSAEETFPVTNFVNFSKGGGVIILYGGRQYYKKRNYANGSTIYRCSSVAKKKGQCNGTITILNDSVIKHKPHIDGCSTDVAKNVVDLKFNECRNKIVNCNFNKCVPEIYNETVGELKDAGIDLVKKIPSFNKVKTAFYDARNKDAGLQKICFKELKEVKVPEKYKPYLLAEYDDHGVRILIFCSPQMKKYFCKISHYFSDGFVFGCGPGYVHLFEKETPHHWRKRNVFRISKRSYKHTREYPEWSILDTVEHITIDPNQETLLITTQRTQLYTVKLFGQHMSQNPEIPFTELGPAMHFGNINSLAMCAWKPIFMTAGEKDKSIRIWNYMTDDIEMIKLYQEEIHCVSLHPTGLFTIVGFSDKLRFMVVLIDDFEVMREFPIRNCKRAKFSCNGHIFAAVNGQVIQIFSSVSFQNVFNLKGHNGKITSLAWSANDLVLVSCGTEGAVYEWSMSTGQRIGEVILKTNQFKACAVNSTGKITFGVGTDGEIKEIGSNTIRRNLPLIGCALDTIQLSRSGLMLFITGGQGGVTTVHLPLLDKAIFTEFHMHNERVTAIALSYDDQTLVTVAEDASICLWKLTNPDGRAIALDKDFAYSKEILISKKDLQEKINNINLLSTRMSELETEHAYQLRQAEATQAEKLKEVHEGYCAAIEELKEKNETMENEHTHEIGMIQQDITKLRSVHERTLQSLEADFNIKLIGEYDRYQSLEDKTARMRKEYEEQLEALAESKRHALREMNSMFQAKLEEKDLVLQELQEQADMEKREHVTIKNSLEDDADTEIIEIRTAYEAQLKEEKDANVRLKGETNLMKKKLITAMKDIDEYKHQIMQLKAEHKQFQKVVSNLEREVADLKKEISERDSTIQDKEKRIYELKRKKQELEKYKFVLNFKITELKNQIDPLERDIKAKKLRILELEVSLESLLKKKSYRDLKISQLNEKLISAKKDYLGEADKNLLLKNTLKKIKIDLHNMTAEFQDPVKLKAAVKSLFHKYVEDVEFLRGRKADEEAVREFYRQRDYLEKQVAILREQLAKAVGTSKSDTGKIMDENCALLTEINNLRMELKSTRSHCFHMESILGLSARYIPPATARAKLNHVTEDRQQLSDKYKHQLEERDEFIVALKEENERLLEKVRCIEQSEDYPSDVRTEDK